MKYITDEQKQALDQLHHAILDKDGKEWFNPIPHELESGLSRPATLQEQIARLVKSNLVAINDAATRQGFDSEEEANDFDVDDAFENDEQSLYQLMQEEVPYEQNKQGLFKEEDEQGTEIHIDPAGGGTEDQPSAPDLDSESESSQGDNSND